MKIDTGKYDSNFYDKQWRKESAENIFSLLLKFLPQINSVVDFGCGLGAWLAVLKNIGINEIKGYDGHWVDKKSLEIPTECFEAVDLSKDIAVKKRYDMAISIEVAEHLPEASAKIFVHTLTSASDIVLFSAAIPYQGGTNHINEQWQNYWYDLFREDGYLGIDIRSLMWNNAKIKPWYKQNIILYVKENKKSEIHLPNEHTNTQCPNIVHPEFYANKMRQLAQNIPLRALYKTAIKRTIKKLLGEIFWKYLNRHFKASQKQELP